MDRPSGSSSSLSLAVAPEATAVAPSLTLTDLLGSVFTFWSLLHLYYQLGEYSKAGRFNQWVIADLDS